MQSSIEASFPLAYVLNLVSTLRVDWLLDAVLPPSRPSRSQRVALRLRLAGRRRAVPCLGRQSRQAPPYQRSQAVTSRLWASLPGLLLFGMTATPRRVAHLSRTWAGDLPCFSTAFLMTGCSSSSGMPLIQPQRGGAHACTAPTRSLMPGGKRSLYSTCSSCSGYAGGPPASAACGPGSGFGRTPPSPADWILYALGGAKGGPVERGHCPFFASSLPQK